MLRQLDGGEQLLYWGRSSLTGRSIQLLRCCRRRSGRGKKSRTRSCAIRDAGGTKDEGWSAGSVSLEPGVVDDSITPDTVEGVETPISVLRSGGEEDGCVSRLTEGSGSELVVDEMAGVSTGPCAVNAVVGLSDVTGQW